MKRVRFDKETKLAVVHELEAGKTIAQVCREHELKSEMVRRWRREYERNPTAAFSGNGKTISFEARIAELERLVGKQCLEIEFLKKIQEALQARLAQARNER